MSKPTIYLIPVTLGDTPIDQVLPPYNTEVISDLSYFIVENVRSARRFLKKCNPEIDINSLTFFELNKHTQKNEISTFLSPLKSGQNVGVISEAGCPAVADPGADVVALAQNEGYKVVPLVGPSSILMALMASGFNGQSFAFNGYLPIDSAERVKKLKQLENKVYNEYQTQIFIETPYRNDSLAEDILKHCKEQTKLCIAMNISCKNESIVTKRIKAWKQNLPKMHKQPCVFLIYK
ncbi:MAG: SAM-dependent methyltransferase [Dysgonamonadaceae bacterium]|jgi:16S rRNA (cytidine1402-2'-O)-methyltransferase|nr:SAM-dependent methyltransferase [Dysgonamonadaceae bacterium]MDD3727892.1 SAM-dependent methyltransferase [Dysgonamonadaceae bacterium]MDD4245719.1 SAM-dependent methyltransferase [Dysgonamonadaceae bacterium]MDD4604730.1 SAM-dependent methyltransferase [Dysgonamonadaceae bacterium]